MCLLPFFHSQFEILDLFWFEVLRKHPELQLDAQGSKLPLPRNSKVNNCFARTSNAMLPSIVSDITCANELVASVDCNGIFRLTKGSDQQEQDSLNLFNVDVVRDLTIEDDSGPLILSPLCNFRIVCARVLSPVNQQLEDLVVQGNIVHSRFVVVNIVLPEAIVVEGAPVDPKKKKPAAAAAGGAKGAPPAEVEKKIFYRILVLDAVGTVPVSTVGKDTGYAVKVLHELLVDCPSTVLVPTELSSLKYDLGQSLDSRKDMFDGLSVDLSLDATLLSVVCSTYQGGCKVFSLLQSATCCEPAPTETGQPSDCLAGAVEGGKVPPLRLSRPPVVAVVPKNAPFLLETPVKSATILPVANGVTPRSSSRLLLTLLKSTRCIVVELLAKSAEEVAALQQQAAAAATTAAAGKGAKGAPPPDAKAADDVPLYSVCLLAQWSMSSPLTSYALDPLTRTLLAVGGADGTVELWNLENLCLVDTLGRHKTSAVTCLSVKRSPFGAASALREVGVTVLSGAADGTLCTYSAVADSNSGGGEHVRLRDYRFDAVDAAVLNIQQVHCGGGGGPGEEGSDAPTSTSLALVQYTNGLSAIYHAPADGNITLLGRLEKRERISFATISTSFCSWNTLPPFEDPVKKVASLKAAEVAAAIAAQEAEAARLLAAQKAAAEAEKAEKAAAKGGKEKAAPVEAAPVPVVEPEAEEEIVPEPYKYVPAPEDIQEHQIDVLPYADVSKAIADSSFSSQWQAHRSILSLSSSSGNIVCSGDRGGEPCMVVYTLASFLRQDQSEATAVDTTASSNRGITTSTSRQLKQQGSNAQLVLTRADTKSTQQLQQLRLTEQHLHSLESGLLPTKGVSGAAVPAGTGKIVVPNSNSGSQQQGTLQRALSPGALARASIARSRQEKQSRKSLLLNNASSLSSLLMQQQQQQQVAVQR